MGDDWQFDGSESHISRGVSMSRHESGDTGEVINLFEGSQDISGMCDSADGGDSTLNSEENVNGEVNDNEFLVTQATHLTSGYDATLELRLRDISEDQKVEQFMSVGCSCTKWNSKSCSLQFTNEYVKDIRLSCMELTISELDLIIMGQVVACTNTSTSPVKIPHHHKHDYTHFLHRSSPICSGMFRFLHAVGT